MCQSVSFFPCPSVASLSPVALAAWHAPLSSRESGKELLEVRSRSLSAPSWTSLGWLKKFRLACTVLCFLPEHHSLGESGKGAPSRLPRVGSLPGRAAWRRLPIAPRLPPWRGKLGRATRCPPDPHRYGLVSSRARSAYARAAVASSPKQWGCVQGPPAPLHTPPPTHVPSARE